jgi:hypothetical protein
VGYRFAHRDHLSSSKRGLPIFWQPRLVANFSAISLNRDDEVRVDRLSSLPIAKTLMVTTPLLSRVSHVTGIFISRYTGRLSAVAQGEGSIFKSLLFNNYFEAARPTLTSTAAAVEEQSTVTNGMSNSMQRAAAEAAAIAGH